jgi:hypothetical protein
MAKRLHFEAEFLGGGAGVPQLRRKVKGPTQDRQDLPVRFRTSTWHVRFSGFT